ncbi:hypothetical protein EVJ50_01445 [Synechococcus sp. RSCCF101]|uniref:hypothetical protein n=1 Tax=Synechococcus sp. RSCCF101 TaxID=2511069 RepID=UPI001244674B|nr:hypothetical protein [Synechococcus sp. RSCCF101]QEY31116.1 hypothetical protein EVJ50_01445 [Synechococcus sp. RSCCF101]
MALVLLLEPPFLRGVRRTSPLGIHVEVLLTTRTGEQWAAERELQRRLLQRLGEAGVAMADGLELQAVVARGSVGPGP